MVKSQNTRRAYHVPQVPPSRTLPGRWLGLAVLGVALLIIVPAVYLWSRSGGEPADRSTIDALTPRSADGIGDQPLAERKDDTAAAHELATSETLASRASSLSNKLSDALDPKKSGWPTEAFSDAATAQLKLVGELLSEPDRIVADMVARIASPDFAGEALRPRELQEVFRDASIVVLRGAEPAAPKTTFNSRGAEGLAETLRSLASPLTSTGQIRSKVKVVGVTMQATTAETTVYFEVSGTGSGRTVQLNATWHCRWALRGDQPPQLASIRATDYEEVVVTASRNTIFSDCTEAALAHNDSFAQQLMYGLPHWVGRIELRHGLNTFARYGGAVGDVNGDGLADVYVCQPGGLPNRLFVQDADGTATDRSREAAVDILDCSTSAIIVDLDNDGDQDLVLAIWYYLLVLENDGEGRFDLRDRLSIAHRDIQSLSATDYDNDGRLDLYITVDMTVGETRADEGPGRFLYHDANDGANNHLYRNQIAGADWSFVDVTEQTGLDINNRRHSLAAGWEDYDNDGDMDLYVANDFGQNCLYRNDDGHFVDIAPAAGVVDHGSGMSVSWGDYDRDGRPDLYVGNMFSSAGNRITNQTGFKADADQATKKLYRRMAKGNTLFRNNGDDTFQEVREAAVEMGRWAWSSLFADLNNDGWEDLLVANGYLTTEDSGDL